MPQPLLVALVVAALVVGCGGDDDRTSPASRDPGDRTSASDPENGASDGTAGRADPSCEDASDTDDPAELEMRDFAFAPRCLEVSADQGVRLRNVGEREHNFTSDALGVDADVSAGGTVDQETHAVPPGTYGFFCKYHRTLNDMTGTLIVRRS